MATTLWHYVIDANGTAYRITRKAADALYEDKAPPDAREREPGGVLLADVLVELDARIPTKVRWIYLIPVLKDPARQELPARKIGLDVAEGLRLALRQDLKRAGASELARLERLAADGLAERIRAGEFGHATYQNREARAFDVVNSIGI